jgi:hypothetical protein
VRRLVVFALLAALALPSAASAYRAAPGDGTLSIRDGAGALGLVLRAGVAIGQVDGVLEVESETCSDLLVYREEVETQRIKETESGLLKTVCVFTGRSIRFRLSGSPQAPLVFRIKRARDFNLSAAGRGEGWVKATFGQWSLNLAPYSVLPVERTTFKLAAESATTP